MVIIALLFYGSSFLFKNDTKTGKSNLKEIKDDLNEVQKLNSQRNAQTEAVLNEVMATTTR